MEILTILGYNNGLKTVLALMHSYSAVTLKSIKKLQEMFGAGTVHEGQYTSYVNTDNGLKQSFDDAVFITPTGIDCILPHGAPKDPVQIARAFNLVLGSENEPVCFVVDNPTSVYIHPPISAAAEDIDTDVFVESGEQIETQIGFYRSALGSKTVAQKLTNYSRSALSMDLRPLLHASAIRTLTMLRSLTGVEWECIEKTPSDEALPSEPAFVTKHPLIVTDTLFDRLNAAFQNGVSKHPLGFTQEYKHKLCIKPIAAHRIRGSDSRSGNHDERDDLPDVCKPIRKHVEELHQLFAQAREDFANPPLYRDWT